MPKLSQRGAVQFIVLLILIAGIAGVVYLVTKGPLKILPKASVSGPITPTTSFSFYSAKPGVNVGEEIAVQILVHSDITAANLFDAKINYDSQALKLGRVDVTSPFIKNWVEQYWGDPGKISLVGGVPSPGFQSQTGDTAPMATLYFTALKTGSTTISFDESSAIYSNTDNTNVLVSKNPITLSMQEAGLETVAYSLVSGWNIIGIPVDLPSSLKASDLLTGSQFANNKCDSIIGFDANKGGATSYFSDPNKAILNNFTTLTAGSGYQVHCNESVTFNISGTPLKSNPALIKGWNLVSFPVTTKGDIAFSAANILVELSSENKLSCDIIIRQQPGADKGATSNAEVDNTKQVYNVKSTDPNKQINFPISKTEGYWVHCDNQKTTAPDPTQTFCSSDADCPKDYYCPNPGTKSTSGIAVDYTCIKGSKPSPTTGTGDGNNDGKVNLIDLSILLSDFNKNSGFRTGVDLNGDGKVNTFDFSLMRNLLISNKIIRG